MPAQLVGNGMWKVELGAHDCSIHPPLVLKDVSADERVLLRCGSLHRMSAQTLMLASPLHELMHSTTDTILQLCPSVPRHAVEVGVGKKTRERS